VSFIRFVVALFLFLASCSPASAQTPNYNGIIHHHQLFIPLRGVFQELNSEVSWNSSAKTVKITNAQREIILKVGNREVNVSGSLLTLECPPLLQNNTVYVPLRFCAETLGSQVSWDPSAKQALIVYADKTIKVKTSNNGNAVRSYTRQIGGITANIVEIPAGSLQADVVLGQNRVGGIEELGSMASRSGAVVAINGTFFEAYGGIPEPWGTLIKNGQVIHIGNTGTAVGITKDGTAKFAQARISVEGMINGNYGWYAYGFNRTPKNSGAFIFTSERGTRLGFASGTSVVVSGGRVTRIVQGQDVAIPSDGYVLNFSGGEEYLGHRFKVGDTVDYRVVIDCNGGDWSDVVTAVGAGPRLVTNGVVTVNPAAEGFSSPKILTMAGARSAIGVKSDGTILLVTVPGATIEKLAVIMQQLGAYNAMNLDGGASSGLWLKGKYITKPGRLLSNALVFS